MTSNNPHLPISIAIHEVFKLRVGHQESLVDDNFGGLIPEDKMEGFVGYFVFVLFDAEKGALFGSSSAVLEFGDSELS